jgi:CRP/FNR family transcriptional regulator, cyclic AMP receptor protein
MHDRRALLAFDPDLGGALEPVRRAQAERQLVARLTRLAAGSWHPGPDALGSEDGIGLLIVDGFLLRRCALEHRAAGEVLGPGDLLRPWEDGGEHAVYPYEQDWRVLQTVTVAVLDLPFTGRLGAYPEVTAALTGRAMARSRRVTGNLVLAQLASVEHRVLLALWHMADQWGRVRPDGVVVPVPLTHAMLGLVVGARRPSVTAALGELAERGVVCPEAAGGFRLTGGPPKDLPLIRGGRADAVTAAGGGRAPGA